MNTLEKVAGMLNMDEVINIDQIKKLIPHRAPFLLIDRVENISLDSEATGIKAVSGNEPYFAGHFPNFPVMPGVLIIEALAQTASVMVAVTVPDLTKDKLVFFTTVEKVRFRHPVRPGDCLLYTSPSPRDISGSRMPSSA